MKFENTEVFNIEGALKGMRNPMSSWDRSDSEYCLPNECYSCPYINEKYAECCDDNVSWTPYCIGENDMDLAQRLIGAGTEHSKFLRQIFVSVDITAPMYWWSEADTYKVGTVANSTSKMHKLACTPITPDCFEMDDFNNGLIIEDDNNPTFIVTINDRAGVFIDALEKLRQKYNETKDKRYWKELIRWLPESWLQTRTWTANYEVLRNMYFQRKDHKLTEWHQFCEWVESLPYSKQLITYTKRDK